MVTRFKIIWFLSSYSPLWLFICIRFINLDFINASDFIKKNCILVAIVVLLILLPNLIVYIKLRCIKNKYIKTQERGVFIYTKEQEKEPLISLEYFTTYMIALVGFNLDSRRELLIFFVCLLFFMYIYVHNEMIYINPAFFIMRLNVYSAEVYDKSTGVSMGRKYFITTESFDDFCNNDYFGYCILDNVYLL